MKSSRGMARKPATRIASARGSKSKKSVSSEQGAPLPVDGSPLEVYPLRCCVLLTIDGVESWHLISFRIGGAGTPHLCRMASDPHRPDWNAEMCDSIQAPRGLRVTSSAWPTRPVDSSSAGVEEDPLFGRTGSDQGSLSMAPQRGP